MAQEFDGPVVVKGLLDVHKQPFGSGPASRPGQVKADTFEAPRGFGTFTGSLVDVESIQCSGEIRVKGDIVLANADCAEGFEVDTACVRSPAPGAVVSLSDEGTLRPSDYAYDTRVVGVVSGAGGYKPGLVLDSRMRDAGGIIVALMGKVACQVDANHGSIEIGDLLTTSETPGHAMKANDASRAFGAVIGKALRPLKEGTGMVPVLVALQ